MGFFDTISGAGRALLGGVQSIVGTLGDVVTATAPIFGPPLAQALAQRVAGGGALPTFAPRPVQGFAPQFDPRLLQPGFGGQFRAPAPTPFRSVLPFAPGVPVAPGFSGPQAGGFQLASFPSGGFIPGISGGGFQTAGFDLPFIDITRQGGGATLSALTSPFLPSMAGARAQPFVAPNPVTGKITWFRPAGRPILWSGDLTTCKRVNRIARRARRARGPR